MGRRRRKIMINKLNIIIPQLFKDNIKTSFLTEKVILPTIDKSLVIYPNHCDIYMVLTTGIVKFVTYSQSFCFLITGGVARKSNTDMHILASSIKEFKEIDFQHEILELKRINSLLTSQESQLKKTDLNL